MKYLALFVMLTTVSVSYGLDCHTCAYIEGAGPPFNNADCDKKPSNVITERCPGTLESGNVNSTQISWACVKATGKVMTKKLAFRGCLLTPNDNIGKCVSDGPGSVIPIEGATDVDVCACRGDKCNGGTNSRAGLLVTVLALVLTGFAYYG